MKVFENIGPGHPSAGWAYVPEIRGFQKDWIFKGYGGGGMVVVVVVVMVVVMVVVVVWLID